MTLPRPFQPTLEEIEEFLEENMEPMVKQAPEGSGKDLDTCGQLSAVPHRGHLHAGAGGRERCAPSLAGPWCSWQPGPTWGPQLWSPRSRCCCRSSRCRRSRSRAPEPASQAAGCQGGTAAGQHPGPDLHACALGAALVQPQLALQVRAHCPRAHRRQAPGLDSLGPGPQASSCSEVPQEPGGRTPQDAQVHFPQLQQDVRPRAAT